jgi:hypothetical protein
LEEDADFFADRAQSAFLELGDIFALDEDLTRGGLEESHDVFEEDAFSAAGTTEDDVGVAGSDVEVDASEDLLFAEGFVELAD